jgi:hypothetical protein
MTRLIYAISRDAIDLCHAITCCLSGYVRTYIYIYILYYIIYIWSWSWSISQSVNQSINQSSLIIAIKKPSTGLASCVEIFPCLFHLSKSSTISRSGIMFLLPCISHYFEQSHIMCRPQSLIFLIFQRAIPQTPNLNFHIPFNIT